MIRMFNFILRVTYLLFNFNYNFHYFVINHCCCCQDESTH